MKAIKVVLMLTSDLLVTRISGGKIKPAYAVFDSENLELASLLIETFKQHVGKTYGDLLGELEGYEEMNYRFIRGLSQLLGRRAVVETSSAVDPSRAREAVFEACEGMALFPDERDEALKKAAKNLSISIPDLERSLWADLEENQILKEFSPLPPAELLRKYNISLTQTLLFRAVDLDIWITGDFQRVLWRILRSGLMYTLEDAQEKEGRNSKEEKESGGKKAAWEIKKERIVETEGNEELKSVHLHLDGPASLFRMSERYGNSFAKLFPILLRSKGWRLKAGILYKGYQGKRVLEFSLSDSEEAFKPIHEAAIYSRVSPDFQLAEEKRGYTIETVTETGHKTGSEEKIREMQGQEAGTETDIDNENEIYDSTYEQQFANLSLGSWEAKREPTVLKAGRFAFVPDFSLQKNGIKVYVEIVGFWTPEYLKKKIEKLKDVKEPVILLINRKLKCSEKDFPAQDVIFFDRKIPANEIMQVLRKYEEKRLAEDKLQLQNIEIPFSGEMISLEEIAAENRVMPAALREIIADKFAGSRESKKSGMEKESEDNEDSEKYKNYVLLENYVIHRQLLERINLELEKSGAAETYADAVEIFENFGLDSSLYYPVLEHLGYKVIWTGLSEENARIKKAQKKEY